MLVLTCSCLRVEFLLAISKSKELKLVSGHVDPGPYLVKPFDKLPAYFR